MEQVTTLKTNSHVCVNRDRYAQLRAQLGDMAARDILSRTMEDIARRLEQIAELYGVPKRAEFRKSVRGLAAVSDQIGMDTLTMVADDVMACIDSGDQVALSATYCRLIRTGHGSLRESCDMFGAHG